MFFAVADIPAMDLFLSSPSVWFLGLPQAETQGKVQEAFNKFLTLLKQEKKAIEY